MRSLVALGWGLVVLAGAGLVTGIPYLLAEDGAPSSIGLAWTDAVHFATGVVFAVFLGATWRAGRRRATHATGRTRYRPQRWLAVSLAFGWLAVLVTGGLALVRFPAPLRASFGQAHLMLAVWSAALSVWHVAVQRQGRTAIDQNRRERGAPRDVPMGRARRHVLGALVVAVVVAVGGGVLSNAASLPAALSAGARWQPTGPATFVDVLETGGEHKLLAGGAGLYLGHDGPGGPKRWTRVGPFDRTDIVMSIALVARAAIGGGDRILVGAADGLYAARALAGPYRLLPARFRDVHAVVVAGALLWCSSSTGMWRSADGGRDWQSVDIGLRQPDTAWALAVGPRGNLYGSDARAVYRLQGGRWLRVTGEWNVVSLDALPGSSLAAASMGDGVDIVTASGVTPADTGLAVHEHGPAHGIHVVEVTELSGLGLVAGQMLGGAAASIDAGRTWTALWPQLGTQGVVWRVLRQGPWLVAATDSGIEVAPVPAKPAPRWWWYGALGALAAAGGWVALGLWAPKASR
ncbi:MAG: hypothetical protein ACYDD4_13810 [Acidimicrobiales bacterium]